MTKDIKVETGRFSASAPALSNLPPREFVWCRGCPICFLERNFRKWCHAKV